MAEPKTEAGDGDVTAFVAGIADERRRAEATDLVTLMSRVTGEPARMWGTGIVGFGERGYRYASGRAGTWFRVGFAPRKQNLVLYLSGGFDEPGIAGLLERLGRHGTGKGCLYLKRLSDADAGVLEELLTRSAAHAGDSPA
jgi:hypothetical protein